MRALLLMSILVVTVAIPIWAARDHDARRGLSRTVVYTVVLGVLFMLACRFVYHRLP